MKSHRSQGADSYRGVVRDSLAGNRGRAVPTQPASVENGAGAAGGPSLGLSPGLRVRKAGNLR